MDEIKTHEEKEEIHEETHENDHGGENRKVERHYSSIVPAYRSTETETTEAADSLLNRLILVVFYVTGVIMAIIGLRFVFLLFGANNTGFVNFIYNITEPFVSPFYGIFGTTTFEQGRFEFASIVAAAVILILAYIVTGFLRLMGRNPETNL